MKRNWFSGFKRFLWLCMVGYMIAWHNVYHNETRLRKDDQMEILSEIPEDHEDSKMIDLLKQ